MNQPLWSRILEALSGILQALLVGFVGVLRSLFGTSKDREIRRMAPTLKAVRACEAACVRMSNDELRGQTSRLKERLADGEALDDILPEAFAVVCEAAKRVTGMRPFDVQIIGGLVLHRGGIAEMVTGEGKTLVATMPLYLNALDGKGVHLVTVNDYLARRDCDWMGPIFEFLGLTVGLIQHDMGTAERQVSYRADITYGTNNEFGFDYLRDNMAVRPENRVQRGLNYAIVDEIDSILVDEARTPLIISGRPEKSTDMYFKVDDALKNRRMRKDAVICWAKDKEALAGSMRVHVTAFKNSADLVGRMRLSVGEIGDPREMARDLKNPTHGVAEFLHEHLEDKTLDLLEEFDGASTPSKSLQNALVAELREAAHDDALYTEERFAGLELSDGTRQLIEEGFQRIDVARLNLNLLKEAFPGAALHTASDLDPMADYLRRKMPGETLYLVDAYAGSGSPSRELQAALTGGLSRVLHDQDFFSEERFAGVSIPDGTRQLVRQRASARDLAQINRLLLEAALPGLATGPDLSADPLAEYVRGKLSRNTLSLVDLCDGSPDALAAMEKAVDSDLLALEPRGDEFQFLQSLVEQEQYQDLFAMDAPYSLEEKGKQVIVSDGGMLMAERLLGVEDLFVGDSLGVVHMLEQGLRSHHFYKRDDEYVVRNGEVLIVDDFTGRIMEGRRYSDGLHQALEAKERVPVQFETQTVASITYQNFFKLYNKISGMTGTAATEAVEFAQIYDLDVVQVPTNLPLVRDDMTDLVFATEMGKFRHVVGEIMDVHDEGRPLLVGTVSIEKSELLAKMLQEAGVDDFQVLNAKHHGREAAIVANAGKRGAITIATNMAGRGTDIKLGEGVRELGGLAIIGTERHDSRRIDDQLRGRCGRQGDPGTTRFFLSLEDEVARLFGGDKVKRLLEWTGSQQEMDDQPLGQRVVTSSIRRAQKRVEEYNFEIRKHVKEYDDVMNRQRQIIYEMRRDVIEDRDVTERLHGMFENLVGDMANECASEQVLPDEWDLEGLGARFKRVFGFEPRVAAPEDEGEPLPILDDLLKQVLDEYKRREEAIADEYRQDFRTQIGGDESLIDFGALARKYVHDLELMALLRAVDDKWIDHLYSMDYLRESVRLRAFGQKDPLLEYKTEGYELFQEMMASIEDNVVQTLFRLTDPEVRRNRQIQARRGTLTMENDPFAQIQQYTLVGADKQQDSSFASYDTSRFALGGQSGAPQENLPGQPGKQRPKQTPVRNLGPQVGPNDPCPCGSGKKYKKCCGGVSRN